MALVVIQTDYNSVPVTSLAFPNNPDYYVDSVYFGDTIIIPFSAIDTGLLNNSIDTQLVSISVNGLMMGLNDTSSMQGCPEPPCAYLNSQSPISGISCASGVFTWQTSINHLLFGDLQNPAVDYYFVFKNSDDYCPASNHKMIPVKIVIMDHVLPPPILDSFQVNPVNGHVTLFWTPVPNDTTNSFRKYYIYYKDGATAGWQLTDSIDNINTSTYTHTGVNGTNEYFWYHMKTLSGHSYAFYSDPSNVLTNFYTGIEESNENEVLLQYNPQSGDIELSGACKGEIQLSIINQLGQTVYNKSLKCNSYPVGIFSPGNSGVYLYQMRINGKEIKGKILVP